MEEREGQGEMRSGGPPSRGARLWIAAGSLLLLGSVLGAGRLRAADAAVISGETTGFLLYVLLSPRMACLSLRPVANLLGLYPGHLVLLLAAALVSQGGRGLVALWMALPVLTVLYDAVSRCARVPARLRFSISAGLYAILWGVLFAFVERLIVVGRELSGTAKAATGALFLAFGLLFVLVGILRHGAARSFKG